MSCDHARPGIPEQLAVLRIYRATLNGANHDATRQAAGNRACPECVAVAAASFGITLAQQLAGAGFVNGPLRPQLLGFIDGTERELRAAGN
jgi:hypothetical protein